MEVNAETMPTSKATHPVETPCWLGFPVYADASGYSCVMRMYTHVLPAADDSSHPADYA